MFEKITHVHIMNANNITFVIAPKEESKISFGNFFNKNNRKVNSNKVKNVLDLDFSKVEKKSDFLISHEELKTLSFFNSDDIVIRPINDDHSLETIISNKSQCNLEGVYKNKFKILSDDHSEIVVEKYMIEHARLESNSSSSIFLKQGAIHNASLFCFMFSKIKAFEDHNYIINVEDFYGNHNPSIELTVINSFKHTIRDSVRSIKVIGNPTKESIQHYIDLDGNKRSLTSNYRYVQREKKDTISTLNRSIKINYKNAFEPEAHFSFAKDLSAHLDDFTYPEFINVSSDDHVEAILEQLNEENDHVFRLKENIKLSPLAKSFKNKIDSLEQVKNKEIITKNITDIIESTSAIEKELRYLRSNVKGAYLRCNKLIEKLEPLVASKTKDKFDNIFVENDKDLELAVSQIKLFIEIKKNLTMKLKKIEKTSRFEKKQKKDEMFLLDIVKHDYPTDYIDEKNREKVMYLLTSEPNFFSCFEKEELDKIKRLQNVFNISTKKDVCNF